MNNQVVGQIIVKTATQAARLHVIKATAACALSSQINAAIKIFDLTLRREATVFGYIDYFDLNSYSPTN